MKASVMHKVRDVASGVVVVAVLAVAQPTTAAEQWKPDENTCGQQPNTLAIVDCIQGRTKFWDQRLNQAWKALNAGLAGEPPRLAALKTAQLAWIKYRDANCAYYYSQDGTIKQIATAKCLLEMTETRAIELQREMPD